MELTKDYIKERQYIKSDNLEARINLHNKFSNYSFHSWVWGNLPIPMKPLKILQVGCGIGQFFKENQYKLPKECELTITDFSPAMIEKAKNDINGDDIKFEIADVEELNYNNDSFDIIFAHHLLYHTSINKSLSELKRVVRKDGFVSITTNSEKHMLNLFELGIILDKNFPKDRHIDKFTMEIADIELPKYFGKVIKKLSTDNLYVSDADYIVDFIHSEIDAREPNLNEDFYKLYRESIEKEITKNKFFVVPKISPLYICYKSGN